MHLKLVFPSLCEKHISILEYYNFFILQLVQKLISDSVYYFIKNIHVCSNTEQQKQLGLKTSMKDKILKFKILFLKKKKSSQIHGRTSYQFHWSFFTMH